jgi:hypothetical protein
MAKMSSNDPCGYLKHKLWQKKAMRIKMSIWIPNTKIQESPWFTYFHMACHIPLESFQQGLQLFFKLHLNRRFAQKVMGLQNYKGPNFGNSPKTKWILGVGSVARHKKYYKGEGGGFLQVGPWWVLWVHVCSWFIHAPIMLQLCTNQLVIWFVQACVNSWLTCHFS